MSGELLELRIRSFDGGADKVYGPFQPVPAVTTNGLAGTLGLNGRWVYLTPTTATSSARRPAADRPRYRLPTMRGLRRRKRNGLAVVSTFSGAGGSSLGYRLAGYDVRAAVEFVEAARETYAANFPKTPLSAADVRELEPAALLELAGLDVGELDVLDGSPPCASFSMLGNRERDWGKTKKYSGERSQRNDDLFLEFARLLDGIQPRAFVAENVSSLAKGRAPRGYLKEIYRALADCGYRVAVKILDARWLGVPQRRERLFLIGVRRDVDATPVFPKPLRYQYGLADALALCGTETADSLLENAAGISGAGESFTPRRTDAKLPTPSVTTVGIGIKSSAQIFAERDGQRRQLEIDELKAIASFPLDFRLTGPRSAQWERIGRAVPPLMMERIAKTLAAELL